jgi:hypothetical protein
MPDLRRRLDGRRADEGKERAALKNLPFRFPVSALRSPVSKDLVGFGQIHTPPSDLGFPFPGSAVSAQGPELVDGLSGLRSR